jgi:hypothetical protein
MPTTRRNRTAHAFYWFGVIMALACVAIVLAGSTEMVYRFEHERFSLLWAFAGATVVAFLAAELWRPADSFMSEPEHGNPQVAPTGAARSTGEFKRAVAGAGLKPSTEGTINAYVPRENPRPRLNPDALWLWERLSEFEQNGVFDRDPDKLLGAMTDSMRDDCARILPGLMERLEAMRCAYLRWQAFSDREARLEGDGCAVGGSLEKRPQ